MMDGVGGQRGEVSVRPGIGSAWGGLSDGYSDLRAVWWGPCITALCQQVGWGSMLHEAPFAQFLYGTKYDTAFVHGDRVVGSIMKGVASL